MNELERKINVGDSFETIGGAYVKVTNQEMVRFYTTNGKLLKEFSKKEFSEKELSDDSNIMAEGHSIFIKDNEKWKILTTEGEEITELYENVIQWGNAIIVLKNNKYYFFDPITQRREEEFDIYCECTVDGRAFIIVYKDNKCGLYMINGVLVKILEIKYKVINVYPEKIRVTTIENEEKEFFLREFFRVEEKKSTQIEVKGIRLKNFIRKEYRDEVECYTVVKYYTLDNDDKILK